MSNKCPNINDPDYWPASPAQEIRDMTDDMACRAAAIDATHGGTPGETDSDWRVCRSPGSYRSNR